MQKQLLICGGLAIAGCTESAKPPPAPIAVAVQPAAISTLLAGYKQIPAMGGVNPDTGVLNPPCHGTKSGTIRIKVNKIIRNLFRDKNVGIRSDVRFVKLSDNPDTALGEEIVKRPVVSNFPTVYDIETVIKRASDPEILVVNSNQYVVVRIVLNMTDARLEGVRLLYPGTSSTDSQGTIFQTTNSSQNMFCDRGPIVYKPNGSDVSNANRAYVEFGIQSVGPDAQGGFGIGLLIVAPNGDQTPIIIDPNVKNRG